MKFNPIICIIIAVWVFFPACDRPEVPPKNGTAVVYKNCEKWKPRVSAFMRDSVFFIELWTIKNRYPFEELYFGFIKPVVGKHTLTNNPLFNRSRYATYDDSYDSTEDRYEPLVSAENYIEITSYDSDRKIIKGTFQCIVVRDSNDLTRNPAYPDTIRFTDGEFCVNLK